MIDISITLGWIKTIVHQVCSMSAMTSVICPHHPSLIPTCQPWLLWSVPTHLTHTNMSAMTSVICPHYLTLTQTCQPWLLWSVPTTSLSHQHVSHDFCDLSPHHLSHTNMSAMTSMICPHHLTHTNMSAMTSVICPHHLSHTNMSNTASMARLAILNSFKA